MPTYRYNPIGENAWLSLVQGPPGKIVFGGMPAGVFGAELYPCADTRKVLHFMGCRPGHLATPLDYWQCGAAMDGLYFDANWNTVTQTLAVDGLTWEQWLEYKDGQLFPDGEPGDFLRGWLSDLDEVIGGPVTMHGPTMSDYDPPPDFAFVTCWTPRTYWFGYHEGCDLLLKGCGTFVFDAPYAQVSHFGECRIQLSDFVQYDPHSPAGYANGNFGPFPVFDLAAGDDPTIPYIDEAGEETGLGPLRIDPPLPDSPLIVGRVPAIGGILRPPTPGYNPNPNSNNFREAVDAYNLGNKDLWKWSDVEAQGVQFTYGRGGMWYKAGLGETTSNFGEVFLVVRPFWRRDSEITPPGRIGLGPVANHIRQIRGGRIGNTDSSHELN